MADFLLEIFSEEIPARMQLKAVEQIKNLFEKEANIHNMSFDSVESFVTPQRLVLFAKNIPEIIQGSKEEVKGPSIDAPERAIEGFSKSANVDKIDLEIKEIKGRKFYFAYKKIADKKTQDLLQDIVGKILSDFHWPKSMRWANDHEKWVRPIRNILCLLGSKKVDVKFAGVSSSLHTFGHRFMSPEKIMINSIESYFTQLAKAFVILDHNERKNKILDQTQNVIKHKGLKLAANNALINEVTGLVEYPKVLLSKISEEFLELPSEILITSMAINQKYFSFEKEDGSFAPFFAVTANIESSDENVIIEGNRKVLEARLYDAKFFYESDRKKTLDSRVDELKKVTFHEKLGSILDKVERIKKTADFMSHNLGVDNAKLMRAAHLCKADLVTEVVYEFPELQGVMGKYYALNDKEDSTVAEAIEQHYLPVGRDDDCPDSIEGAIISIADKIDTIVGLFSVNEKPTSSKDPFALRRASISIIRIILDKKFSLDLDVLVDFSASLFVNGKGIAQEVKTFIADRLLQYYKDQKYSVEIIEAVLSEKYSLYDSYSKIDAITKFLSSDSGAKIYLSIKRINNILLDNNSEKNKVLPQNFTTKYEEKLYNSIENLAPNIENYLDQKNYLEALNEFGKMSGCIAEFFDNVMVIDKDINVKNNRLALLQKLSRLIYKIANFSKIK